jgi:hypothetical protein
MIDMDPELRIKLRAKYDRIKAENPPAALANFDPLVARPSRKVLNLMIGAAAIAVVAAGIATFALQLSAHLHATTPAATAPATTASSNQQIPQGFPSLSPFVPASVLPLLVGDTYADGSASLPTFTPTKPYSIQYACLGTGSIDILSSDGSVHFTSESCVSPGVNGLLVPPDQITGKPVSLRVETTASTAWELRVMQYSGGAPPPFEGAPPSPHPGYPIDFRLHAGETLLIPDTHGTGSLTLPTFTPTTKYWDSVVSCSGPGSLEIIGSDGSTATQESCKVPAIGSGDGGEAKPGVPISLLIKADPGTTWEIIVYGMNVELPQP